MGPWKLEEKMRMTGVPRGPESTAGLSQGALCCLLQEFGKAVDRCVLLSSFQTEAIVVLA